MRRISSTAHGLLDYVVVLYLALGPSIAEFHGRQRTFCYALAVAHLLLTFITRHRFGILRTIPMWIHGLVELFVGALLLVLPWIADFAAGVHSRNFFLLTGMIVLLIWAMSDYRKPVAQAMESKRTEGR